MTISFPLTLPTVTGLSDVRFTPKVAIATNESPFTLSQEHFVHSAQLLQYECSLPAMRFEAAREWTTFFLKLNGSEGTFLFRPSEVKAHRGAGTGTPVINGSDQKGRVLNTSGWTVSTTNILRAGDYISFGSGEKTRLHRILMDVDSDASGNASLDIWPLLRESPTDGASIDLTTLEGTFKIIGQPPSIDSDPVDISRGISFTCREAF